MGRAAPLAVVLGLVATSALASKPEVRTRITDRYLYEPRVAGDGAPIVHVPDDVPEPLFLYLTRDTFTVWWRARHTCDKEMHPSVSIAGNRLLLDVKAASRTPDCEVRTTVFETTVRGWGQGPREVKSRGAPEGIGSRWVSTPSAPRPKELTILADRVREQDALRRLGERIAWRYHEARDPRAAIAAYRWLVGLDELHWRTPLYHARIFHNSAFNRSKASALASLESLSVGVLRLKERIARASPRDPELAEMQRELADLEAFLEPALYYLALKWHSEVLHRWQAALNAYRAYLRVFPTSENAPLLRFYFGSALLATDDGREAREQFRLASLGLRDSEQRQLAAACAVVLGLDDRTWEQLAPCRAPRPSAPPFSIFPEVKDERFARPKELEE